MTCHFVFATKQGADERDVEVPRATRRACVPRVRSAIVTHAEGNWGERLEPRLYQRGGLCMTHRYLSLKSSEAELMQ